jgi:hypothetical protein
MITPCGQYVNARNYVASAICRASGQATVHATTHVRTTRFVYISAGIPAEHRGCYQVLDPVTHQSCCQATRLNHQSAGARWSQQW